MGMAAGGGRGDGWLGLFLMGTAAQRQSLSSPGCRRRWLVACAVVRWVAEAVMAASVWVVSVKEDGMMVCGPMERKAADGIHDDNGVKKKNEDDMVAGGNL
ncbi:hypothetical protein Dimus_026516 [Dionaea muscipula]